jgi:hypothetical protein
MIHASSRCGHATTLLQHTGTNGVESHRQLSPLNLADLVDVLLSSGAAPKCRANMYGGNTARALFESSKHSREARVHEGVIAVFDKCGR